ncbi:hypothetical protein [Massilia horti]|uniref:DUF3077 domain-containing protein n=1 Tax=Massilia horti TaxID=2562153 RepID=A0A4Y9SPT7_9BURK|nr:hypothetical protein [Massilia horti]TFW28581.1 hypothetical protein E4O92_20885 [Massilia horti]
MSARTTAAPARPAPTIIARTPYGHMHVDPDDASDHVLMRARQLAELLLLIQPDDGPSNMLWMAQQIADEIVETMEGMMRVAGDAA